MDALVAVRCGHYLPVRYDVGDTIFPMYSYFVRVVYRQQYICLRTDICIIRIGCTSYSLFFILHVMRVSAFVGVCVHVYLSAAAAVCTTNTRNTAVVVQYS